MEQNRDVQVALAHEFWCCRREFDSFALHATLLLRENTREMRLLAFTAYGNCIRHLYTFYEGVIKLRNPQLIAGVKKYEIGENISELMYQEARKLVRNKIAIIIPVQIWMPGISPILLIVKCRRSLVLIFGR